MTIFDIYDLDMIYVILYDYVMCWYFI